MKPQMTVLRVTKLQRLQFSDLFIKGCSNPVWCTHIVKRVAVIYAGIPTILDVEWNQKLNSTLIWCCQVDD